MIGRGNYLLWNRVENLRFLGPGVRHIARRDYGPARRPPLNPAILGDFQEAVSHHLAGSVPTE
jgi:hypothetical protein